MNKPTSCFIITALIITILLLSTPTTTSAQQLDPVVFFTDNMTSDGTSELISPMEQALLDRINSASIAIDAAFYDFNRTSIRDALIAAKERGVIVRIVADDEAHHENETYRPFFESFNATDIIVQDDEGFSGIMHNKYFIIDGEYLWTGSTNVTDNGFTKNHNNALLFESTELADYYQTDFNQMWSGFFGTAKTNPLTATLTYNGYPLQVAFSPTEDVIGSMIEQVNQATTSIDFSIFFFTDDDLANALIAARERGVQVRGLWDQLGAGNSFSRDDLLCQAGVLVKREDTLGKMHNKYMVIDANTASPRTITGSLNWTGAGNRRNSENSLFIQDPDIARAYDANFQSMWDQLDVSTFCRQQFFTYLPSVLQMNGPNVRISTIVYNPDGDDTAGEKIILKNEGTEAQSLNGWILRDEAGATYTFADLLLQPQATITLWTKAGTDTITDAAIDLYWGRAGSAIWNNGGDIAQLINMESIVKDTCSYEGGGVEVDCRNN